MKDFEKFRLDYFAIQLFIYLENYFDNLFQHFPFLSSALLICTLLFILALFIIRWSIRLKKSFSELSILLELTPPAFTEKSAYTTQQLFSVIHNLGDRRTIWEKLLGKKIIFSFEIVSTLNQGIRYLIRTTPEEVNNVKRSLLSYLPQVSVKVVNEYLPANIEKLDKYHYKITEFKLKKHFAYPLHRQDVLAEHDPIAYLTGMMTKLSLGELISFQIVLSPTKVSETNKISRMILNNEDVLRYLDKFNLPSYLKPITIAFNIVGKIISFTATQAQWVVTELTHGPAKSTYALQTTQYQQQIQLNHLKPARVLSSFEQEAVLSVQQKIDQSLFEVSIRFLAVIKDENDLKERTKGFISSISTFSVPKYQSLNPKLNIPPKLINKIHLLNFKKRLLSLTSNSSSVLLSVSEIGDLYHFPYSRVTQTENIVKVHSKELPAPISLKQGRSYDVLLGNNTYGGTTTPIGLLDEERETHMYIIGRTGSGKTTMIFNMAKHDIESGAGLAFIDPHGDVADNLVAITPESRKDDLIFLNPFDLKHPLGINLLELTPGLDEDEAELEKEVVAEGIISLFRKVFSNQENTNAHRIEYILRNTIYTAFTIEDRTIFTIYDLLNNPPFQKQVISKLTDENLKNFWKFEFGRAGDFQVVKMVGGVTAKIGRFLFSPTAKRILEQKKSTIDFNEIMDSGKILICNLSQGKLGEDTTRLLGTTILTKIQQAALRRAYIPQKQRRPFYLYVDEFQNFATQSFTKMLSEARKYGLRITIVEQSTSQQQDRNIVNIILANVTTVVCFRGANPIDEELMLAQFSPYIDKGEIMNLPRYKFYIKVSALNPEEPFSGETIFIPIKRDEEKIKRLLEASRKNWAIEYVKPSGSNNTKIEYNQKIEARTETRKSETKNGLPERRITKTSGI